MCVCVYIYVRVCAYMYMPIHVYKIKHDAYLCIKYITKYILNIDVMI